MACNANVDDAVRVDTDTGLEPLVLNPPPTICTASYGCGATTGTAPPGGTTGSSAYCPSAPNRCFGAIAIDCDGVVPNEWPFPQIEGAFHGGCLDGWCWVNAGSWADDQCCFSTPSGRWCGGPLSANNAGCVAAWNTATHRLSHGLDWRRYVNMCTTNTTGIVEFAAYCAPDGTVLASTDTMRSCSGLSRAYDAAIDGRQAQAQGVSFDDSFTPAVCAPVPKPASPTKSCTTSAQCASDETCYQGHCVQVRAGFEA